MAGMEGSMQVAILSVPEAIARQAVDKSLWATLLHDRNDESGDLVILMIDEGRGLEFAQHLLNSLGSRTVRAQAVRTKGN